MRLKGKVGIPVFDGSGSGSGSLGNRQMVNCVLLV